MNDCVGTSPEMKGLVHDTITGKENLQQIMCNTAKEWFENPTVK